MSPWECTIAGDEPHSFDRVEDLIVHQATAHDRIKCGVCHSLVPDGYLAIRHMFEDHSRREFVRAYDASPAEVRWREDVKSAVEETADLQEVVERIDRNEGS